MKVLVADNLSSLGVDILKQESGIDVDVNTGLPTEELIKIITLGCFMTKKFNCTY